MCFVLLLSTFLLLVHLPKFLFNVLYLLLEFELKILRLVPLFVCGQQQHAQCLRYSSKSSQFLPYVIHPVLYVNSPRINPWQSGNLLDCPTQLVLPSKYISFTVGFGYAEVHRNMAPKSEDLPCPFQTLNSRAACKQEKVFFTHYLSE